MYTGKLVIKDSLGTKTFQMATVELNADNFPDLKKEGARVTVNAAKPFEEEMDGKKLMAINTYKRKNKEIALADLELAPCCITTPRLYCGANAGEDVTMASPYQYEKRQPITLTAKFQFPQNVFDIQPTSFEDAEIKKIGEFITKKYQATKIYIEGFASPEGKVRRNKFLSIERSKQVRDWLTQQLKTQGYTIYLDSTFFEIRTTTEDWEGFKSGLDQTNYPEDVKRQIIQIIAGGDDEDVKERRVMALVGGATEVEAILAPLRRATIRLEGATAAHTDEQMLGMIRDYIGGKRPADSLRSFFQPDEMLYAISLIEKPDDKMKALTGFTALYPSDYRGYNDQGALSVMAGNFDKALEFLKTAKEKKDNDPAVLNNTGLALMRTGKILEAQQAFEQSYAAKNTPEAAFNTGIIYLKQAQYQKAGEKFDAAGALKCAKYNAALCKLLYMDIASAKSDLETSIRQNKDMALNYYLMGVLGARSDDITLMVENLKQASLLDEKLSQKAKKDLEFRRYFSNEDFKNAVKK